MSDQYYAVISDQHFHSWTTFSTTNEDGINSRLKIQLSELRRCADELKKVGGKLIINAGDTFHQRGNLTPTVLNPVIDLHRDLIAEGFRIVILSGNHDAELRNVTRLSSSVTSLEGVGCKVINETTIIGNKCLIPWHQDIKELKEVIERVPVSERGEIDLFLHAPIDGVIVGIPDHGLTGEYLSDLGFKRVFSGHYHSFCEVAPNIYSIGASTHQTFSDVGSKAGFLIVNDKEVKRFAAHSPKFIDINLDNFDDAELLVDGNYVRCRIDMVNESDVALLRQQFLDWGAVGVTIIQVKTSVVTERGASAVTTGSLSLESSVSKYVELRGYSDKVDKLCLEILNEIEDVE